MTENHGRIWRIFEVARDLLYSDAMLRKVSPLIVCALLAFPGQALAQTISVTINNSSSAATSGQSFPFHLLACQQALQGTLNTFNQFQMDWTVTSGVTYQAFWSTDPACDAPSVGDGGGDSNIPISVSTTNQVTINGETILNQVTGEADPCDNPAPPNASNGTVYICITGTEPDTVASDGTLTLTPFYIAFEYDMNPPPASTGVSVSAADSELDCSWNFPYTAPPITTGDTDQISDTGDNADHFIVYAQPDETLVPNGQGGCVLPDDAGVVDGGAAGAVDPTGWPIQETVATPSSENSSVAITGLTNNQCYDVSIIAFYPDGTQGYPTPVQSAAPIEIWDYWRLYHAAGGTDDGGLHCQSAGGGLVPLALAAAGLLILRRRRRTR